MGIMNERQARKTDRQNNRLKVVVLYCSGWLSPSQRSRVENLIEDQTIYSSESTHTGISSIVESVHG